MYYQFREKLINIWLIQLEFKIQFEEKKWLVIYHLWVNLSWYSDVI